MSEETQANEQKKEGKGRWLLTKITNDWIFGEVLLISAAFIIFYAVNFHGYRLSLKTEDWAHFATYLSGTVGVTAVVATLIVLVRTLGQQNLLIKNQEEQLEQSKNLLKVENEKTKEIQLEKEKEKTYVAIYLLHRFERINNFFDKAEDALGNKNAKVWRAIANKHPALIDDFLLNEQGELISLLSKLDSQMALDCIGAVDSYKETFAVISSYLSKDAIEHEWDSTANIEIRKFSEERRLQTIELVQQGHSSCKSFLKQARKTLEKERRA